MKLLPPLTKMIKQLADSGAIEAFGNILQALVPWIGAVASAFVALKIGMVIQWFVSPRQRGDESRRFSKKRSVFDQKTTVFGFLLLRTVVTAHHY